MSSKHGDTAQAAVFKPHEVNLKILKLQCTLSNFSGMFAICQDPWLRQPLTPFLGLSGVPEGQSTKH